MALLLLLTAGCRQLLGFESPTVAGSDGPPVDTVDTPITCTNPEQRCPAEAPICAEGICVECLATELALCAAEQPVCGSDLHCRACASHDECVSEVCLISGACADEMQVAYVAAGSTGTCTKQSPCARVALGMQTGKPILKVTGTVTDTISTNLARTVDVYGDPGAVITRTNNGPIVDTSSSGTVTLHDIAISGGTSTNGVGIRGTSGVLVLDRVRVIANQGLGLDLRGQEVVISRSILAGNLGGGGRIENTKFAISNTLIVQNGSTTTSIGGLRLKADAGSTLELTTIANNTADLNFGNGSGLDCEGSFEAHSSIVTDNTLGGNCAFLASLFDIATPGTGNRVGDPTFLNTDDTGSADFYRLGAGSAALDGALSTIVVDIDGQPRLTGASDMGADERP